MKIKLFEVRDVATFIPVLAIKLDASDATCGALGDPARESADAENYLLRRVGYPLERPQVMLTALAGERHASADPYFWGDRTYAVAHEYIAENFDDLPSGAVVDVEYVLGETNAPKRSERY